MTNTEMAIAERPETVALVRPAASATALLEAHREIAETVARILDEGTDYGVIPGTGDRPTLLKPGAERLALAFGTTPRYSVVEREADHDRLVAWTKRRKIWEGRDFHWQEETGTSHGVYRYVIRCELVRRETGTVLGDGLGVCSTVEAKYIDRPRDSENTVLKMAEKRALVAAVLNAFGLSGRFTQDVEDLPARGDPGPGVSRPGRGRAVPAPVAPGPLAAAATSPTPAPPVLPFGRSKGRRLDAMEQHDLDRALAWARDNNKYSEFQGNAERELARRATAGEHRAALDTVPEPADTPPEK